MIHVIDLAFQQLPGAIAAFLVETSAGPVLIETGPYSTIDTLQAGIRRVGYQPEDIAHVLPTHIHFDHAGAAWWFAQQGATVCVHPRGAKHLADPERLWGSAKRIYGDQMEILWGKIEPIRQDQLAVVEDRSSYIVGDTTFVAHHTPGHAVHHIAWQIDSHVFTGDVAGVRIGSGPVVPPCPPPDIHIEDWERSIERLRSLEINHLYLTHFGQVDNIGDHLDALRQRLRDYADWMRPYAESAASAEQVLPAFETFVKTNLKEHGVGEKEMALYELANPSWMSVAGLLRYWHKHGLAS